MIPSKKPSSWWWQMDYYHFLFANVKDLINKRHGSRMLKETASRPNHRSYRQVYLHEFVPNSLCCNMGMIFWPLTSWRLLEAKNDMKELIYRKKYIIKVSQQPQKPLNLSDCQCSDVIINSLLNAFSFKKNLNRSSG